MSTARTADADLAALLLSVQSSVPQAMRSLKQWLLWRFQSFEGDKKPRKVPFYVSGRQRKGTQGGTTDLAELATFDIAATHLALGEYTGLGFAFLPGDGLIGIDIDGAIDPDTGEVSQRCQSIIDMCGSYTELSPSGKGVHIIVEGHCKTTKHDSIGVEVFCGSQYFTVTGRRWGGTPDQVAPIADDALQRIVQMVAEAKEAAREAARAARAHEARARRARSKGDGPATGVGSSGSNDFAMVNAIALRNLDDWVPVLLPDAKPAGAGGWRVTSRALGRKLQEDLSLHPDGIRDFGTEEGLTPIDVVVNFAGRSPKDALHWLAAQLHITLSRAAPRPADRPATSEAVPPADEGPPNMGEDPPPPLDEAAPPPGTGGKGARKKHSRDTWDRVHAFLQRFALVYGGDSSWDRKHQMLVRIPAMRLAYGKDAVNLWLAHSERQMVLPTDLVFEPGREVPDSQINMFGGLEVEPIECTAEDVAPMLVLLRHLCAESAGTPDEIDAIVHWVLCWQALPLQQLGAKMQTALVFHGAQGTGKNLYFDLWRDLYGVYGITVGQTELEDKFNGWVSRKLAIIGDEVVSRQEMYHNKNRLKLVVTQHDKFPIRGMLQETRWESNHANVVFLSNESQPLALEERDRRYQVVYTPLEADASVYQAVRDFKAAGGVGKWLYYLQNYPLDGFDEHTKPLLTQAKIDLIEAAWKPPERFGHEWLEGVLDLPMRVCSAEQLYMAFKRWCDERGERWPPSQSGFTNQLNRWVRERVKRDATGRHEPPALQYKVIGLRGDDGRPKAKRCWLPNGTAAPNGVAEGEWAAESVREFQRELDKFCRRRGDMGEEGDQ